MKKILVSLLILTMVISFVSCGSDTSTQSTSQTKKAEESLSADDCLVFTEIRNAYDVIEYSVKAKDIKAMVPDLVIPGKHNGKPVRISHGAFYGCTSLKTVTISEGCIFIGYDAFHDCTSLKSITIPEGISALSASTFENCTSLESVTMPKSITKICEKAFYGCKSLKSMTIPENVKEINENAFAKTNKLQSIGVSENNPYFCSVDGILYSGNKRTLIACPGGKTNVVIPDNVSEISKCAFDGCECLTSVKIPDSVSVINSYTFCDCTSLKSADLPGKLTKIGFAAFRGCSSLKSITIPASVSEIGESAFSKTPAMQSIEVENGSEAFCSIDGVLYGKSVFSGKIDSLVRCPSTKTSVTFADGVSYICSGAFEGCASLKSVTIPDKVTGLGESAFENCTSLSGISLPDKITAIPMLAFSGCTALKSVSLPANTEEIDVNAFAGCTSLSSITLPENVSTVESRAFAETDSLKSIDVAAGNDYLCSYDGILYSKDMKTLKACPGGKTEVNVADGVNYINSYAFYKCNSLTKIRLPESITEIDDYAFSDIKKLKSVEIATGNSNYCISDGILYSKDKETLVVCFSYNTQAILPKGVKTIGEHAFKGCEKLLSVSIPSGVEKVYENAFKDCPYECVITIDEQSAPSGWNFEWNYGFTGKIIWK